MTLYFITGNKGKFEDSKKIFPEIKQLDVDLPEIQDIDSKEIIKEKVKEAFEHVEGEFIVEDTSLSFDCLNGLPGPLIKWFMKTIDNEGLYNIVEKLGKNNAEAKITLGYARSKDGIHYFEGSIKGKIVSPRGEHGFGWDPIFEPEGFTKTLAEMTREEKNSMSMRKIAMEKLKKFLDEN
ncbi:MAG: RdgB/HAM1 family non-canonical purine NTP pyrophosphatase [Candidatus Aenigmarchaeota archaeon]|nr:RdgB/HAM1 family non-canonical purine NTP pyrophosphatase [Candidatus Aenigmarchaeota archaeon]